MISNRELGTKTPCRNETIIKVNLKETQFRVELSLKVNLSPLRGGPEKENNW